MVVFDCLFIMKYLDIYNGRERTSAVLRQCTVGWKLFNMETERKKQEINEKNMLEYLLFPILVHLFHTVTP
jgi:hypothetical protein